MAVETEPPITQADDVLSPQEYRVAQLSTNELTQELNKERALIARVRGLENKIAVGGGLVGAAGYFLRARTLLGYGIGFAVGAYAMGELFLDGHVTKREIIKAEMKARDLSTKP